VLRFSGLTENQLEYMLQVADKFPLDVWSEYPNLDIRVAPEEMSFVQDLGIPYSIFIEDLGRLIANEQRPSNLRASSGLGPKADDYFASPHLPARPLWR